MEVKINNWNFKGKGKSKQQAKHAAATQMIEYLKTNIEIVTKTKRENL